MDPTATPRIGELLEGRVDVRRGDAEDAERVIAVGHERVDHIVLLGLVPLGGLVERDLAEAEVLGRLLAGLDPGLEVRVGAAGNEGDAHVGQIPAGPVAAGIRIGVLRGARAERESEGGGCRDDGAEPHVLCDAHL